MSLYEEVRDYLRKPGDDGGLPPRRVRARVYDESVEIVKHNAKLEDFFVSDEEWEIHLEAEWKKNLRQNLDRVFSIVFDWRLNGIHTDKVAHDLGLSRCRTLKLLHILKRDGMIAEPKADWWKDVPWEVWKKRRQRRDK